MSVCLRVFRSALVSVALGSACSDTKPVKPEPEATAPTAAGASAYAVKASLFAKELSVVEKSCTLSDGTETTCLEVKTPAMPGTMKPYCRDGFAYGEAVAFASEKIGSCKGEVDLDEVECVECTPQKATQTWLIPKRPVDQPTPVDGDKGWQLAGGYGLALDGVPVSHPPPPKRSPVPAVDVCGGHSGPDLDYHYHYIPTLPGDKKRSAECLIDDQPAKGHSALFAYAMDGYPMYGRYGEGGKAPADLDSCGGHTSATPDWPDGVYHYHATGAVDADHGTDREYLAFIRCFKGAIASSDNPQRRGEGSRRPGGGGPPGGGPPGGAPRPERSERSSTH